MWSIGHEPFVPLEKIVQQLSGDLEAFSALSGRILGCTGKWGNPICRDDPNLLESNALDSLKCRVPTPSVTGATW